MYSSTRSEKRMEAELEGRKFAAILDAPYRWERWAAPKSKDGTIDYKATLTGDDLRDFVNAKLFPHLHGFEQKASGPNTIEYKIGVGDNPPYGRGLHQCNNRKPPARSTGSNVLLPFATAVC